MIRNDMTGIRALLALAALVFVLPQLGGCNTLHGTGRDIERAGEEIQEEVDENR